MVAWVVINRHQPRPSPPPAPFFNVPTCQRSNLPTSFTPNSFPLNLFADPHPLTLVPSIFYKNIGGGGHSFSVPTSNLQGCNLFICHRSENTPVSPSIATLPKTQGLKSCVSYTSEEPRGRGPINPRRLSESEFRGCRIDGCAGAFLESMNRIDGQVFKAFDQAAGPADLDPIDLGACAETEMYAHVVVGDIARPAADFVDKSARAGLHGDLRADAVAIRSGSRLRGRKRRSDRAKRNPMIAIVNVVHQ